MFLKYTAVGKTNGLWKDESGEPWPLLTLFKVASSFTEGKKYVATCLKVMHIKVT
jgi:hypothetical protein